MSDPRKIRDDVERDRQRAPGGQVIYLEGATDVPIFFALLGRARPRNDLLSGEAVVVGLDGRTGSGGSAVRQRVKIARESGYAGVYGILDGDGKSRSELDVPVQDGLVFWPAYCIENLLAQVVWPAAWGEVPDWAQVFERYVPYVALNRLHVRLRDSLKSLELHRMVRPGSPLWTLSEVEERLKKDRDLLSNLDVHDEFHKEVLAFRGTIQAPEEAHALLNGKWLVEHFAPERTGRPPERCRAEWCEAAREAGGHPHVRALASQLLP